MKKITRCGLHDQLNIQVYYQLSCVTYVESMYTSELEKKDTTEPASFVSYLNSLLERDIGGNLAKIKTLRQK